VGKRSARLHSYPEAEEQNLCAIIVAAGSAITQDLTPDTLAFGKTTQIIRDSRQLVHGRERGDIMRPRLMIAILCMILILPATARAATLVLRDDFEDMTLNKWDSVSNVVNFNAGSGAFSGSRVARGCWGDNFNILLNKSFNVSVPAGQLSEIYLRYRIKYEPGFDWSDSRNDNNKHVRIRTAAVPNGFFDTIFVAGTRGWLADGSVINNNANIPDQFGDDFTPDLNRWYLYEFFFKLNTGGAANGSGYVRVNGTTLISFSDIMYRTADNVFFEEILFPGNNAGVTVAGRDCVQLDNVELWSGDPTADTNRPKSPTDLSAD